MNKRQEIAKTSKKIKFDLAADILDLIEEYINKVEMQGTSSGYELYGTPLHNYLLKLAKKQRQVVSGLHDSEVL